MPPETSPSKRRAPSEPTRLPPAGGRSRAGARPSTDPASAADRFGATIQRHRTLIGLAALSVLLQSLIFAPISLWPFVFICLVPWLIMAGGAQSAPRVYAYSFLMAMAFFLINMRWLYPATGAGYVALCVYQSLYFPLIACPIRHMVRRRGWPLAIAFPCIWTASELLRGVVLSGFPWFFLSHSLYEVLPMIQVSDLAGAYGVSFVVAAVNGAVADLIFARLRPAFEPGWGPRPMAYGRRAKWSVAIAAVLLTATLAYGIFRLQQDTIHEGPRVAVLQGDFVMTVDQEEVPDPKKREIYFSMLEAAAEQEPDLYVLPETPWIMYLNSEIRDFFQVSRESFNAFQKHAREHNAYIVTGSASLVRTPNDLLATERRYNSATVFRPDGAEPGRYDKVHLVYFGEVVPFRFGRLRPLYFLLNRVMPFSNYGEFEYSLFPGQSFRSFSMEPASDPGRTYRFGIPICYEDVIPYVAREFVSGGPAPVSIGTGDSGPSKRVDFLLNISNDGWFGRGIQQPQHLAVCVFRAVENRVGIARSVNTGVSAFIEPSGEIHHKVEADPGNPWPNACGFQVANVGVDSRYSVYSRSGDWFGWACAVLLLLFYIDYWTARAVGEDDETDQPAEA